MQNSDNTIRSAATQDDLLDEYEETPPGTPLTPGLEIENNSFHGGLNDRRASGMLSANLANMIQQEEEEEESNEDLQEFESDDESGPWWKCEAENFEVNGKMHTIPHHIEGCPGAETGRDPYLCNMTRTTYHKSKKNDESNYFQSLKEPSKFIAQVKEKYRLDKMYRIQRIYLKDEYMRFCPVLVKKGPDLAEIKDKVNNTKYQLQVWDREGRLCFERSLMKEPIAAAISKNSKKDNRHTFVYVPAAVDGIDGHSDIHIVELNYSKYTDTPYEYRVRDWENIFGRMSQEQSNRRRWADADRVPNELNNEVQISEDKKDIEENAGNIIEREMYHIGVTAQYWIVIVTKKNVYYADLKQAIRVYKIDWYSEKPERQISPEEQLSPASRYYLKHAEKMAKKMEEKGKKPLWDCDLKEFDVEHPQILRWKRNGFREGTTFRTMYESHITTKEAARQANDEAQNKAGEQAVLRKKNGYNLKLVWDFQQDADTSTDKNVEKKEKCQSSLMFCSLYEAQPDKYGQIVLSASQEMSNIEMDAALKKRPVSRLGTFRKLQTVGIMEETMNEYMRVVVAKFRCSERQENTYDIYLNTRLVQSIKPQQDWSWDAEKRTQLKTVLTDFHLSPKEIWFYGQQVYMKDTERKSRKIPRIMFKIKLSETNRISANALTKVYEQGCRTKDDFKRFLQKKDASIKKLQWEKVRLFYKPYTSFMEVDLNVLCAHGRNLSVYDRDTHQWKEVMHTSVQDEDGNQRQLTQIQRKNAHIEHIFVTEAQEKKQFHVLRSDGFLLEAYNEPNRNLPARFPDVLDKNLLDYTHKSEDHIVNVGNVQQVAFDQGRRSIHLILSKKHAAKGATLAAGLRKTEAEVRGRLAGGLKAMQYPPQLFAVRFQKFGQRVIDISDACAGFIQNNPCILETYSDTKQTLYTFLNATGVDMNCFDVTIIKLHREVAYAKVKIDIIAHFQTQEIYDYNRNREVDIHQFRSAILQFSKQEGRQSEITSVALLDARRMIHIQLEPVEREDSGGEESQKDEDDVSDGAASQASHFSAACFFKPNFTPEYEIAKDEDGQDKVIVHLDLRIKSVQRINKYIYTVHDTGASRDQPLDYKVPVTTDKDAVKLVQDGGVGIIDIDAYEQNPKNRPVIIPLTESLAGVNSEIGFARRSQSLYFQSTYAELEFLPLPHRNTVPFEKCQDRVNYIMTQRLDNFFIALDKKDLFSIWDMTTGQQVQQKIALNTDLEDATIPNNGFKLEGYKTWTGMLADRCYSGVKIPENEYINNDDEIAAPTGEFVNLHDSSLDPRVLPSFYSQNLFPYTLLYKEIPYTESQKKMMREKGLVEEVECVIASIEINKRKRRRETVVEQEKMLAANSGIDQKQYNLSEKVNPVVHIHFTFRWEVHKQNSDLFFSFDEKDFSKGVKVLEIRSSTVINDLKIHYFMRNDNKELERDQNMGNGLGIRRVKCFPMELVKNPFHAYTLFSPDFEHYIDVLHLKTNHDHGNPERAQFVVMSAESGKVVESSICTEEGLKVQSSINSQLKGGSEKAVLNTTENKQGHIQYQKLLHMKHTDSNALSKQLQLLAWNDNNSIALIDSNNSDNICKVVKVLNRNEDGKPQETQFDFQMVSTFVVPYLSQIIDGQDINHSKFFQFFNTQVVLPLDNIHERYLMVHNELAKYKNLKGNVNTDQCKKMYGDIETMEDDPQLMEQMIRKEMIQDGKYRERRLLPEVRQRRKEVTQDLNNLLFQVDFFSDKRFMLQLPFSIYDWALMNVLSQHKAQASRKDDKNSYYLDMLMQEQSQEQLLMVLPECNTLLGLQTDNLELIQSLIKHKEREDRQNEGNKAYQLCKKFDIPFIKNFEGHTPMHKCLYRRQNQVAEFFLRTLAKNSFGTNSVSMTDILHLCVSNKIKSLPFYFDSRKMETSASTIVSAVSRGYEFLEDAEGELRVVETSLWPQPRDVLDKEESLLDIAEGRETDNVPTYSLVDIPNLTELFEGQAGDQLCKELDQLDDEDYQFQLFQTQTVQAIIQYRWVKIRWLIWILAIFWIVYIVAFITYVFGDSQNNQGFTQQLDLIMRNPECIRDPTACVRETEYSYWKISRWILVVCNSFNLIQELIQIFLTDWKEYVSTFKNYTDLAPSLIVLFLLYSQWNQPIYKVDENGSPLYVLDGDGNPTENKQVKEHVLLWQMVSFMLLSAQAIIYLPVVRPLSMFKTIFKTIVMELSSFLFFFFFSIIVFAVFFCVLSQGEAGMVVYRDSEDPADNEIWERCLEHPDCNRFSPTDFFEDAANKTGGSNVSYFGETDPNYWYMPTIWVYRSVLGDYDFVNEFYKDKSPINALFAWCVFFFSVFITIWIMQNLVIAIIENNYDKIKELTKASQYKERCQLTTDNMHLIGVFGICRRKKQKQACKNFILIGESREEFASSKKDKDQRDQQFNDMIANIEAAETD